MIHTTRDPRTSRRGSALLVSLFVVALLTSVASAMFTMNMAHKREVAILANQSRAIYLAEAAVNESLMTIAASVNTNTAVPDDVGTHDTPIRVRGGRHWSHIVNNGDGTYTVTATGSVNLAQRTVRTVIAAQPSAFDHAIYAGNSSGDPAYTLELGGDAGQADVINGDVYSGGDIEITGDASVTGDIKASGSILGGAGEEGVTLPAPDIAGMNYETNHDFDVAALFAGATAEANALGGTADQVLEDNPAHIFRRNPDDRQTEIDGTAKDDYFLEDPYELPEPWIDPETGKDLHGITLSGIMGKPGPVGNGKVFYIDGNMWVHNGPMGRLWFMNTDGDPVKVTIVVKGNIYFSDDVLLEDPADDGIAFIAIKDDLEPDSGNIYLGDPIYGTVDRIKAFLYAENNFYDNNLDEDGSKVVAVTGNMTAGNQVAIDRDHDDGAGNIEHSKLTVDFDDRISTGALDLPGLPKPAGGIRGYDVVLWTEAVQQ